MLKRLSALTTLCVIMNFAHAECVCRCVSGHVESLCKNTYDIPPICSPEICPVVPPSIPPIQQPYIPPIGTKHCENRQVLNPYTHQYEWKSICE